MAEIRVLIENEELKEKEAVVKLVKGLKKNEILKLKGFLEGLAFASKK